ncbi:hypothetical protein [Xanthobacter sediminis]
MSKKNPQWGGFQSGPTQGGPQQSGQWSYGGWNAGQPGYGTQGGYGPQPGYGPQGPQPGGPQQSAGGPRIDALDVLEGVLKDGFSLSNLTRIARASGSNFWIGTAIGAGVVVLLNRPDVRAVFSSVFSKAGAGEPPSSEAPPKDVPKDTTPTA